MGSALRIHYMENNTQVIKVYAKCIFQLIRNRLLHIFRHSQARQSANCFGTSSNDNSMVQHENKHSLLWVVAMFIIFFSSDQAIKAKANISQSKPTCVAGQYFIGLIDILSCQHCWPRLHCIIQVSFFIKIQIHKVQRQTLNITQTNRSQRDFC